MILGAKIYHRRLSWDDDFLSPRGTNIDRISFLFDKEWTGYEKWAVFEMDGETHTVQILDRQAAVPDFKKAGIVRLGVIGKTYDDRLTSTIVSFKISESMYTGEDNTPGIKPNPGDTPPEGWWDLVQAALDKKQDKMDEITAYEIDEILMGIY